MNALKGSGVKSRASAPTIQDRKRTLSERDDENDGNIIMSTAFSSDGEDSDSSSDSSSTVGSSTSSGSDSSSTTSTSSGSSSSEEASMDNIFEEDECGRYLNVSCACNEARFYIKRFARGSVGKCILFKGRWITPNEFQAISGRKSSKDWKRSIRLKGRCLKEFIAQGLFQEHAKTCACKICSGDDVDMLKREGEMALAAKRRRLSQADSHSSGIPTETTPITPITTAVPHANNSSSPPTPPLPTYETPEQVNTHAKTSTTTKTNSTTTSARTRREKIDKEDITPPPQKIWSPSGELAHNEDGSSLDNEDEYQPDGDSQDDIELKGVVDSRDFLPRRSRRSVNKRLSGHRTELGTFKRKPSDWDPDEVAEFLKIQGYPQYADPFVDSEIDGQSLFLLREQHLMERFKMKLGPALRLLDTICRLRHPPVAS